MVNYFSYAFLLARLFPVLFLPWMVMLELDEMDQAICPKTLECADPCIVEADPDIAGIGVSGSDSVNNRPWSYPVLI